MSYNWKVIHIHIFIFKFITHLAINIHRERCLKFVNKLVIKSTSSIAKNKLILKFPTIIIKRKIQI